MKSPVWTCVTRVLEALPVPALGVDRDALIRADNAAFLRLLEGQPARGLPLSALLGEDALSQTVIQAVRRALQPDQPVGPEAKGTDPAGGAELANGAELVGTFSPLVLASGKKLEGEIRRLSLTDNGGEETALCLVFLRDAAQEPGAAAEAAMLMKELTGIIESSGDGIYVTDGQGKTLRINAAYERIAGVRREEVLGRTMNELIALGFLDESASMQVLRTKRPHSLVQRVRSGASVVVSGTPLFDERGEISRVVTTVRDVAELNRLRDELEKTDALKEQYEQELERLRAQPDFVVRSAPMRALLEMALRVAAVDSAVLIGGESGVGKEMIAEFIHRHSPRKDKPFLKINCAAIPESLFESELFGYARGAFTGANREGKAGLFEAADGGTLLLDEIGELPIALQPKLLRVIQERQTWRIGDLAPKNVDVRLLASSNRDLRAQVEAGLFREDLYYRLSVVPLLVPPLRDRTEDVLFLLRHFLRKNCVRYGLERRFSREALDALLSYSWPGNVRELENMVERVVVVAGGMEISLADLPFGGLLAEVPSRSVSAEGMEEAEADLLTLPVLGLPVQDVQAAQGEPFSTAETGKNGAPAVSFQLARDAPLPPLKETLDNLERSLLAVAFARHGSSRKVAKVLGIDQSTALRKARRLGIVVSENDA